MKQAFVNVLVVLALASGVVLIAITAGLFPAAEPRPIPSVSSDHVASTPLAAPKVENALAPRARPEAKQGTAPDVAAFGLCDAPAEGARIELGAASAHRTQTFFVWCKGGYALFEIDLSAEPSITKLATLPSKMPRPGGALIDDMNGDGLADLVVAVAPALGVIHAAGSGVYVAHGRAQGGYEPATPWLEMPVVAIGTAEVRPAPLPHNLFVLTRGDAAARRQGELHAYETGGVTKKSSVATGLSPRDLRFVRLLPDAPLSALVVSLEPGRVLDVSLAQDRAAESLTLTDAIDLCASDDAQVALVRSTHDLLRVSRETELSLSPWFRDANVGPCAAGDVDRDGSLDALAVTDSGVIWLRAAGEAASRELLLPKRFRAIDIATSAAFESRSGVDPRTSTTHVLVLALDTQTQQLVALVWPALPWSDGVEVAVSPQSARGTGSLAEIPLE